MESSWFHLIAAQLIEFLFGLDQRQPHRASPFARAEEPTDRAAWEVLGKHPLDKSCFVARARKLVLSC